MTQCIVFSSRCTLEKTNPTDVEVFLLIQDEGLGKNARLLQVVKGMNLLNLKIFWGFFDFLLSRGGERFTFIYFASRFISGKYDCYTAR